MYSEPGASNNSAGQFLFEQRTRRRRWYSRWWGKLFLIFIAIVGAAIVAVGFYSSYLASLVRSGAITSDQLQGTSSSANRRLDPAVTLATDDDPSLGPRDARVVVVEFGDFECPACGAEFPVVKQLMDQYKDRVRFVFRDLPLTDIHPNALNAALAANCAFEQGKFWEMHDTLYTHQDALAEEDLKRYAVQLGLNSVQFGDCWQSSKYLDEVENDTQTALSAGVQATPTFFINGQPVQGAIPYETFQQLILKALGS